MKAMETDRKWVIVRIDGKIAAISTDYRKLAEICARLADCQATAKRTKTELFREITATTVSFTEILKLKETTEWEGLMLFGTEFQKMVWKKLWSLTHPEEQKAQVDQKMQKEKGTQAETRQSTNGIPRLISYSDFAELCQNKAGVRPVAHAVGLNPIAVLIPCHLVIPKESIDKIREIQKKAESTIFKGDDLCFESILSDPGIDFGEYALGREVKRELIRQISRPDG